MGKPGIRTLLDSAVNSLVPWMTAALASAFATSLIQSQMNLGNLVSMGAPLTFSAWWRTNLHDLMTFMPFFAVISGSAFLGAFAVASWPTHRWPKHRCLLYSVAGFAGIFAALLLTNRLFPLATLIAATRHLTGNLLVLTTGALGGWIFCKMRPGNRLTGVLDRSGKPVIARSVALLLIPPAFIASSFMIHRTMMPEREIPLSDYEGLDYRAEVIAGGLAHPWGIAFLPDGRKLISELSGGVRIVESDGALLLEPLRGVPEIMELGQGGLLDIAISPNFEEDRYVFLSYSCGEITASNTCLSRSELQGNELVNTELLFQAKPPNATALQFGSRILFLPDNTMLVSVGDGFDFREEAQNLEEHYGKLLRLTMDGEAPQDNPFYGQEGHYPEIYSYGHRNPQGLFYDMETNTLYESEHGPYGGDEINIVEMGKNYGWPVTTHGIHYAGDLVSPYKSLPFVESPIYHWSPSIAPSGITLYRGNEFPQLQGNLLVSALGGMAVFRLQLEDGQVVKSQRMFHELGKRIRDIKVGPDGGLYLLTDHDPGELLRIVPTEGRDNRPQASVWH
ncbi:MAG: PQQ-dependent sugar dehydrogenase [Pseudohongiellaceae bacterium]